jgi:hypothetical protein
VQNGEHMVVLHIKKQKSDNMVENQNEWKENVGDNNTWTGMHSFAWKCYYEHIDTISCFIKTISSKMISIFDCLLIAIRNVPSLTFTHK